MSQEEGDGSGSPEAAAGRRQVLKKGPWTAVEDSILLDYVRKHGEGNWNAVQRNSGLLRCGKSCRLRWANHLRPNLKKGAITPDEEMLIIELHAKYGNKWARMASQLPGRTDNEIKNYWNTRVKRRQRAGLPIYPRESRQHRHYHQQNHLQPLPQILPNSSPSTLSSLLSPPPPPPQPLFQGQNPSYNRTGTLFDAINYQPPTQNPNSSYLTDPNHYFKILRDNNGGLALSLSSLPPLSSALTLDHQGLITSNFFSKPSSEFDSLNFSTNQNSMNGAENELHSIQRKGLQTTQDSNGLNNNAGVEYEVALSSETNDYEFEPELMRGNSGLLGDLLVGAGAGALIHVDDNSKDEKSLAGKTDKGNSSTGDGLIEDSTATKTNDVSEDVNIMDDDFFGGLLDFHMTVPVPDWYDGTDNISNGQSTNVTNVNVGMENIRRGSPQTSTENTSVPVSPNSNSDVYWWKNMSIIS
ncbi:hypothetical protein LguiB_002537 [Lonicera macranthoides]